MARYLVDGDSYEFIEGVPKSEHVDYLPLIGQTMDIIYLRPSSNPRVFTSSDQSTYFGILETPLTVSEYSMIEIEVFIAGLTKGSNYSSGTAVGRIVLLDGDANIVEGVLPPPLRQTDTISASDANFSPINVKLRINPGQSVINYSGYAYYLGEKTEVEGKSTYQSAVPAIIGGAALQLYNDSDISTCGVIVKITGVK